MLSTLQNTKAALEDSQAALEHTKAALEDSKAALEDSKAAFEDTKAALEDSKAALEDSKAALIKQLHAEAVRVEQLRKEYDREWQTECQSLRQAIELQLSVGRDQRANVFEALIRGFTMLTDI